MQNLVKLASAFKLPKSNTLMPPPLKVLYADKSKNMVIIKGAQAFISTWAFLTELIYARFYEHPVTIIHSFPTIQLAGKQASRLRQIITLNKAILGEPKGTRLNIGITNLPSKLSSYIYFVGAHSFSETMSTDADILILDEWDRPANPEILREFSTRLLASDLGRQINLSVPYSGEGRGIHELWLESDQHIWTVKCRSCNREVQLYSDFWEWDETQSYFKCPECGKPLDPDDPDAKEVRSQGRFVPQNPKSHLRGYHISRLLYPFSKLQDIYTTVYRNNTDRYFNVHFAGLPDPLPAQEVTSVNTSFYELQPRNGWIYSLGIDVSNNSYFIVLAGFDPSQGKTVILYEKETPVSAFQREIAELIETWNIKNIIVDFAPERWRTKELLAGFRVNIAFIQYSNKTQWFTRGKETILFSKSEALKQLTDNLREGKIELNRNIELARAQVMKISPHLDKNSQLVWDEPPANDFLHAMVYAWLATIIFPVVEGEEEEDYFDEEEFDVIISRKW